MTKKQRIKDLYEKVKAYIEYSERLEFTKEEVAKKFNVREHEISYIFMKLNQEGLLHQPHSDHWTHRFNSWSPDIYVRRKK